MPKRVDYETKGHAKAKAIKFKSLDEIKKKLEFARKKRDDYRKKYDYWQGFQRGLWSAEIEFIGRSIPLNSKVKRRSQTIGGSFARTNGKVGILYEKGTKYAYVNYGDAGRWKVPYRDLVEVAADAKDEKPLFTEDQGNKFQEAISKVLA